MGLSSSAVSMLVSAQPEKIYGSSLLKVADTFEYVLADQKVTDLAEVFQARPSLSAVGVCDSAGRALGLVSRVHLFGLLGKPYGREILSRKPVSEITEEVPSYDMNANLFQIAERLQESMDRSVFHHYLLTDTAGHFRGLFSSKDLLVYLSKITQQDILLASQLQERLVKHRTTEGGAGWSVEAFNQSAKGLGGDFYHVMPLPDGKVFVALGDVSGKGVAASVLTSLLWGVLQFYDYQQGLPRLLTQINEALIRTFHLEKYLTGVFLVYEPATRRLSVADMGHGHGWFVRKGRAKVVQSQNLPLGIDLELSPQILVVKLQPGDMVCLYTDGLTEQEDENGRELGEEAVLRLSCQHWQTPQQLPAALIELLSQHQGSVPRLDDVTWLQMMVD